MSRERILCGVLLAVGGAPVLARADTVVVDGVRLEGVVVAVTSRSVTLRLAGSTIALDRDRVSAVTTTGRRGPAGGLPAADLGVATRGPRGAVGGDRLLARVRALATSGETERALRLAQSAREGRVGSPALEDLERSLRVAEATAALGSGCPARALERLGTLDAGSDPGLGFALGRCRDELGDGPGAGETFGALLDASGIPSVGLATPVRRELARLVAADQTSLARLLHEVLSPPVRPRTLESEHISLLDAAEGAPPDLASLERSRSETLRRLGFDEREVPAVRHLVAVTGTRARLGPLFAALGLARWVGACAGLARGPGGPAPHIFSARPLEEVFAHEVTHLVVAAHRGTDCLPPWGGRVRGPRAGPRGPRAAHLQRAAPGGGLRARGHAPRRRRPPRYGLPAAVGRGGSRGLGRPGGRSLAPRLVRRPLPARRAPRPRLLRPAAARPSPSPALLRAGLRPLRGGSPPPRDGARGARPRADAAGHRRGRRRGAARGGRPRLERRRRVHAARPRRARRPRAALIGQRRAG